MPVQHLHGDFPHPPWWLLMGRRFLLPAPCRMRFLMPSAIRYFHGGVPGLKPGDLIEPHAPNVVDGCRICEARAAGRDLTVPGLGVVDPATRYPGRVYISSDREYSRFYASKFPLGDLYTVEPLGEVAASMEDPFPSWTCEGARVLSVVSRAVRLTDRQRRTLTNRWGRRDKARALARLAGGTASAEEASG